MSGVFRSLAKTFRMVSVQKVRRVATPAGTVARDTSSLMQQRGWTQTGERKAAGPYATQYGTWPGRIEHVGGEMRVFIKNPPMLQIARHAHRPCFHEREGGWWLLHLATEPVDGDVNAVIMAVERIVQESFRLAKAAK